MNLSDVEVIEEKTDKDVQVKRPGFPPGEACMGGAP